jgi:hypothetical protein
MKLAIRVFALSVVVAGFAAASVMPKNAPSIASHLSATGPLPTPNTFPRPNGNVRP